MNNQENYKNSFMSFLHPSPDLVVCHLANLQQQKDPSIGHYWVDTKSNMQIRKHRVKQELNQARK
jgi:hypothetical protein